MNDDERDRTIRKLRRVALEAQRWAAALKELLVAKGIITDREFAQYVDASRKRKRKQ